MAFVPDASKGGPWSGWTFGYLDGIQAWLQQGAVPPSDFTVGLDFTRNEVLDPRITATGGVNGTRTNSSGVIVGSVAPRYDYDPVTRASKGILIEEARTNLILRNAEFDNIKWGITGGTWGANSTTSPAGTLTGDKFIEDSTNGGHQISQSVTGLVAGSVLTASIYVKAAGRNFYKIAIVDGANNINGRFDLVAKTAVFVNVGTGVGSSATITDVGGGWFRCAVSGIINPASVAATMSMNPCADSSFVNGYQGDGVSGVYLWGAQLEVGAFATSWIPTLDAAVTRTADILTMTGTNFSSWYNAATGTFVCQAALDDLTAALTKQIYQVDDGTVNNAIYGVFNNPNTIRASVRTANVNQGPIDLGPFVPKVPFNIAQAYAVNDLAGSARGAAVVVDNTVTLPAGINVLRLGTDGQTVSCCHIQAFKYFPRRCTNAELQLLSA